MTKRDYDAKLEELDRLLNDPDVAMEPSRVWSLLAEVSQHDTVAAAPPVGWASAHQTHAGTNSASSSMRASTAPMSSP